MSREPTPVLARVLALVSTSETSEVSPLSPPLSTKSQALPPAGALLPAASGIAWLETLGDFWTKINNDWIFNLAGLLADNFLLALFPVLLLAGFGVALRALSPNTDSQLQHSLASALPGTAGTVLIQSVATDLKQRVGFLLVVGLISAFLAGSRLFVTLENCIGIIFRLRGRNPLRQNRMAFRLLALYLLIVPIVFLVANLPAGLVALVNPQGHSPLGWLLSDGARLLIWFAAALLFCGATYAFVPPSATAVARVAAQLAWDGRRRGLAGATGAI